MKECAVITGAASGIGLQLAKQFAQHGYDLIITAEDEGLEQAAEELRGLGAEVRSVQVDLATYAGVEALYAVLREAGSYQVVVLSFDETDLEEEINIMRLNTVSVVHLTKRVLPDMIAAGGGKLLFTSSKAFVQSFAEAIRKETQDKGIVVASLRSIESFSI
ncbi:MAG: SDR family NAD(P)-dependent oxidoreductase [Bdellovibrionales bacterium]|nr:SDR family NAD(P)-dependent oxidoreductase [Bdellovibrionales bacterium]